MPPLGLSHSFSHYNSNPLSHTNFRQKLMGSYLNFSNILRSDSYADANQHILTRSNFHLKTKPCALHSNFEALGIGGKPAMCETTVWPQQSSGEQESIKSKRRDRRKKYFLQFPNLRRKRGRNKDYCIMQQKTEDSSNNSTLSKSCSRTNPQYNKKLNMCPKGKLSLENSYPNKCEKSWNTLVRSVSLPSYKTFSEDWLKPWLWKCHSLEDWMWCLEEQPCQSRNFSEIATMLPNDYKLVYVSSSSSDSDECADVFDLLIDCPAYQSERNPKKHLKMNSHNKINYGAPYVEVSDWELPSDSEESDAIIDCKTGTKINETNNSLKFYVDPNSILALNRCLGSGARREIFDLQMMSL